MDETLSILICLRIVKLDIVWLAKWPKLGLEKRTKFGRAKFRPPLYEFTCKTRQLMAFGTDIGCKSTEQPFLVHFASYQAASHPIDPTACVFHHQLHLRRSRLARL